MRGGGATTGPRVRVISEGTTADGAAGGDGERGRSKTARKEMRISKMDRRKKGKTPIHGGGKTRGSTVGN